MRILFLFICFVFVACNQSERIPETTYEPIKSDSLIPKDTTINSAIAKDSSIIIKKKKKTLSVKVELLRFEEGVNDDKFNGEPIIVQLELSKQILAKYPDTIKRFLKASYLQSVRRFPRSISCNFEKGTSNEQISYPKLNYTVNIFKDCYATKPYQTKNFSVRKDINGIIVVE
jgi:hypothetical protein